MEFLSTIIPYVAWFAVFALFSIPALWGAVFTFTLLGHLTQFVFKKEKLTVNRR